MKVPDHVNDQTPGQTAKNADSLNESSLLENAQLLWLELSGLSVDRIRLATLETLRAGESLVSMVILGVMVAVLLIAAWLGLLAAAVLVFIETGFNASNVILLAVAATLLLTLILIGAIRRKSRFLQFPSTLRSLQPLSSEQEQRNVEKAS
jgi:hypothetical protein